MQSTQSKIVSLSTGQSATGVKTLSDKDGDRVREVPVISKERIALFSGIETSAQFTDEPLYVAFAGISR
jgi:hypothetical protein